MRYNMLRTKTKEEINMQYLSDKNISQRYQIARSTVWLWTQQGRFPKPVKLNGRTRWKLADLEEFERGQESSLEFKVKMSALDIYQMCLSMVVNGEKLDAGASQEFVKAYKIAKEHYDFINSRFKDGKQ